MYETKSKRGGHWCSGMSVFLNHDNVISNWKQRWALHAEQIMQYYKKINLWIDFTLLIFSTITFPFFLFFLACLPISLMCLYTENFSIHKESIISSLEKVNMHEKGCWYYPTLSQPALWMQAQNVSCNEWQLEASFLYKSPYLPQSACISSTAQFLC